MKITKSLKRITNLTAVIVLMLGVIPFAAAVNVTTVFADGEGTTEPAESPSEEAVVEEVTEEPVESPSEEAPAEEVAEEPVETPAEEAPAEEVAEEPVETEAVEPVEEAVATSEESELADPEPVEPEAGEDLSELVEVLDEAEAHITDENGEALPLGSKEAAEVLVNGDPFLWDDNIKKWVGYTSSGTGCPANVLCMPATLTPFQDAVTHARLAGTGNMIYVAGGDYTTEDVVVDVGNEGLSFTAFHTITVPYADQDDTPTYTSSYALLNSITLNVNFGSTKGVYAKSIIVNGAGIDDGRLEDGLALVNDGGTVEADMVIYGAPGGHYRVKDAHNTSIAQVNDFEWECGEPDESIWPGHTYRMILKDPYHKDILDYYEARGDERKTYIISDPSHYLDLPADERIEDLLIGVNLSEEPGPLPLWTYNDEERIYWYLLGDIGRSRTPAQQARADAITNGDYDDFTQFWNAWFMWPKAEGTNRNEVSPANRQLTFFVYDPRSVYGCTDPEALNYDPNATESNGLCRYENTIIVPPAGPPAPLPIPVTGEIEELFLIPVTGVDPADTNGIGLMEIALFMSVMALGAGLLILRTKKQKEH